MVVGGDAIVNGARRFFTENTAETNRDLDGAKEPNREGKGFARHRKLTTETQEWSARSERARGGRNRRRRWRGVDAVNR